MVLDNIGFDLWADGYDETVKLSDLNNDYPFAGYKNVMNFIYKLIRNQGESFSILDIGIGTGVLATKLYQQNYDIYGIDFSKSMLAIAKNKMPYAKLLAWDFTVGIPEGLINNKFDFIISTYALHHVNDLEKIKIIKELSFMLKPSGMIVIGDISFETKADLEACKVQSGEYWDEEEFYFISTELINDLSDSFNCEYTPISHCSGVLILTLN